MFKRIIINALAVAAGMSAIFGCTNKIEEPFVTPTGEPSITLQLHTGKKTRATDPFNEEEDKINSVDLFFFKGTGPDPANSAAVFAWHGGSAVDGGTLNVSIPLALIYDEDGKSTNRIDDLFDRAAGDQCTVYTVVNWSGAQDLVDVVKEGGSVTISKLRALKATTEFFATSRDFDASTGIVMFTNEETTGKKNGETTEPNVVKFSDDGTKKSATGHLYVQALAAKIDLFVDFAESVEGTDPTAPDDGTEYKWKPAMRPSTSLGTTIPTAEVHLVNGLKAVRLGGWANDDKALFAEEDEYFDTRVGEDAGGVPYWHRLNATAGESATIAEWATNTPFYTYPNKWEISPLELHRTTLLLKVDWLPYDAETGDEAGKDAVTTYYTVPLNLDGNELEPSNYYRVKVMIKTLGGQNFGEPVELNASVEILKWGHAELEADIREVRYLRCEQKVYDVNGIDSDPYNSDPVTGEDIIDPWTDVLNNTETTTIPFYTSHKVKVASVTVRYHYYLRLNEFDLNLRGYTYKYTPGDVDIDLQGKDYEAQDKAQLASKESLINPTAFTLNKEELESGQYAGVYIDEMNSTLTVYHQFYPLSSGLTNGHYTYNKVNKYAPYEIVIKLQHADDSSMTEEIRLIQYPPINIVAQKNKATGDGTYGNVFINGQNRNTETVWFPTYGWDFIGGIKNSGLTGLLRGWLGSSSNPNMYVFTIQNLEPEDAPWHIGDTRNLHYISTELKTDYIAIGRYSAPLDPVTYDVRSSDDLTYPNGSWDTPGNYFTSSQLWYDGELKEESGHRLTYYYPAEETPAEEQRWMISPKFRVASSFGSHSTATQNNPMERNEARKRCASYQEDGYPAGRWRLPTPGEMAYIARLQYQDIIPEIFETGRGRTNDDLRPYWTSHGLYEMKEGGEEAGINEIKTSGYVGGLIAGAFSNRTLNVERRVENWTSRWYLIGYVRCVYDDWYWTMKDAEGNDIPDKLPADKVRQFHWGDKEKTNPLLPQN